MVNGVSHSPLYLSNREEWVRLQRNPLSYGRGGVSEVAERKREARAGGMSYRLREGERAFTHGDNLVI